jgi:hypothetical protein
MTGYFVEPEVQYYTIIFNDYDGRLIASGSYYS